jgi:hypothetical protein
MQQLLVDELAEMIELPTSIAESGSERSLHIAAATLAEACATEINATRVVGALGSANPSAFEAHVAQLAAAFALDARVRVADGGFSVRFSRPACTL